MSNLEVLNAVLYVLENGCKWRSLPREYGNWNTIYVRLRRWARKGVLQKAFLLLQEKGNETRNLAVKMGYIPVVPPKSNRKKPWEYDKILYKYRNQIERLFRRIKRFRRIFTRYDKLDIMFITFVFFAFIVDTFA